MSETRGGTCVTSDDQSSRQQLRPNVYDNIQPKPSPVLCEPLHPRFAELMDRITSFDDPQWPIRCPVKPNDLAAAGFYYYGESRSLLLLYHVITPNPHMHREF